MFVKNFSVWFMFAFFAFCGAGFVEDLPKCRLKDEECLRDLYQGVISHIGKNGIAELGIPPVDPIDLHNVTVNVLNLVNLTLVDGIGRGIKDCVFEKFTINITGETGHQENTCDFSIKGHYKLESNSPLTRGLFGEGSIHGDGNGRVKIQKLQLKFDFPFYAQKRSDGEIYMKCLYDDIKYDYKIGGITSFNADNIYVGDSEISQTLIRMLNENSAFIMSAFGQPFIDKALKEFYFKYAGYFFDRVPARHYIIDDLSPYAKP